MQSGKKIIGTVLLLLLVITWALIAMVLGQHSFVSSNGLFALVYYIIGGIGWILPAMPIIRWMNKEPKAPSVPQFDEILQDTAERVKAFHNINGAPDR